MPRDAAGMSFCSSGSPAFCICCFSRISPPRCSVAAGERPARSTISRRIPSSCTAAEAKKKRRHIPISRRSSSFPACLYFGRSRSLRRVHLGALRQRDHRVFRQTRTARRSRSRRDPSCRGDHGMRGRARHQIRGARLRKFRRERSGAHLGGAERVLEIAAPRTIGALCAVDCVSEALGQRPKCGAFPHTEFRGIRRRTDCVPVGLIAAENAHRIPR